MTHSISVDVARRVVLVRVAGPATRDEVLALVAEHDGAADVTSDFAALIDLRELSVASIAVADVRAIAATKLRPLARRALVASNLVVFGLCRMYATLREIRDDTEPLGVFRTMQEAEDWLGLRCAAH